MTSLAAKRTPAVASSSEPGIARITCWSGPTRSTTTSASPRCATASGA
jgi:hypothetical protein